MRAFAVCSDTKVGKRSNVSEDIGPSDLAYPATTNASKLFSKIMDQVSSETLTVIFSTYQSINVISDAQKKGLPEFDLVICDEAHRTTGVTVADEDESHFVKIHDNSFIKSKKRLYMTATPRIYEDGSKSQAQEANATLASMDDTTVFGKELHRLGFGEAVAKDLLSDYKVLVLAVDESYISRVFQSQLADENHELNLEDAAKIVGCWNGLAKYRLEANEVDLIHPMRRAVAFARSIKESQKVVGLFSEVIDQYRVSLGETESLRIQAAHVDGTFNALRRNAKLDWLKEDTPTSENICRILSNARCLSEGVDVPALDAVIFLNPRNSVVDVVQSVGRVMRKHGDKSTGYVILPIGVPSDMKPEEALADNKKYKVVWQVLQALRAHDDRFNAMINQIELNHGKNQILQVIGVGGGMDDGENSSSPGATQQIFHFPQIAEWREAIYAKIVQKVGDRRYWEDWAQDVVQIAERHILRIETILIDPNSKASSEFSLFLEGLRNNLNDKVSKEDAVEMLAQHLITKPVFDALFDNHDFTAKNPVSQAMQKMLDLLADAAISKESEILDQFYESVKLRAQGIDNSEGKQRIISELYEKFFKKAFPRTAQRLGIVYTPIEIVDFIISSVEHVLKSEFDSSISDENVNIIDPFTGTGTFIVRLIQSGFIPINDLERKYKNELHANEIILLAYYIAAINIETAFHDLKQGVYEPFEGIVLTDTFQMYESDDALDELIFPQNNARVVRQKSKDIRVVLGNPPYSVGQVTQNDNNQNVTYPTLDNRIKNSYVALSDAASKRTYYDSYIRAIRWASDRLKDRGVIAFVSNGSFIDTSSLDGLRKSLVKDFTSLYIFNLRGNQRTSGEVSRKEGGKIFGEGSRAQIAITILVKNPKMGAGHLNYFDIGDYLSRDQKLKFIASLGSIENVEWTRLEADEHGDWINKRTATFEKLQVLGDKKSTKSIPIFLTYTLGVGTNRDAWAFNFSHEKVRRNIETTITYYNSLIPKYKAFLRKEGFSSSLDAVKTFIESHADPRKISWAGNLMLDLSRYKQFEFDESKIIPSMYKPFCKQWLYFDRQLNERVYLTNKLFPTIMHENFVMSVNVGDARKSFGAIMTNVMPNKALSDPGQCFPLYVYEKSDEEGLFTDGDVDAYGFVRKSGITDATLQIYRDHYGFEMSKEDIFYYVYAVLNSKDYQTKFEADLAKSMPGIPLLDEFEAFSSAGKKLAYLHVNYEKLDVFGIPELQWIEKAGPVSKMRFGKKGAIVDKSRIVVNDRLEICDIPDDAYRYMLYGKSPMEWVMDRYEIKTDKESGIINDPNEWGDGYPARLLGQVITMSIETVKILDAMPVIG